MVKDWHISARRGPGRLHFLAWVWIWWIVLVASTDAVAIWLSPQVMDSAAYAWAGRWAPAWLWASLMSLTAVGGVVALILDWTRSPRLWLLRAVVGVHGAVASVFAASIAWLWLEGAHTAIMGVNKWAVFAAMATAMAWTEVPIGKTQ